MTKRQELELLADTIARFGPDSYIGPWLAEYRIELEAGIVADLEPRAPLPEAARREAAAILEAARTEQNRLQAETRETGRSRTRGRAIGGRSRTRSSTRGP